MSVNVIIAGVGGQGSIMASRIIACAVLLKGNGETESESRDRVRVGETFGAAMRGGAVSSHVRIGDVESPLVPEKRCDLIIGLEPLEALRQAVKYLGVGGIVVLNTEKILPIDVKTGMAKYPGIEEIIEGIRRLGGKVIVLNASELARQAGNYRCMNVVMLGAALGTGALPITKDLMMEAIARCVPAQSIATNHRAFLLGLEAVGT